MKQKQVYKLIKKDLDNNPVWYFSTEDDIETEDEGTPQQVFDFAHYLSDIYGFETHF